MRLASNSAEIKAVETKAAFTLITDDLIVPRSGGTDPALVANLIARSAQKNTKISNQISLYRHGEVLSDRSLFDLAPLQGFLSLMPRQSHSLRPSPASPPGSATIGRPIPVRSASAPRGFCGCPFCAALGSRLEAANGFGAGSLSMLNHGFNRVDRWPTSALGDRPNLSRTPAQELRAPPTLAVAKIGINDIADSDVFNLSSNPLASKTIYLDFDGIDLSETAWNSASEVGTTNRLASLAAFTFDADASFSSSELNAIKEIWMRVAADYAPFEINITTRMPDADAIFRSSESDNQYGTTVSIGLVGSQWSGAGGVAWLGAFSDLNSNFFKPALVFSNRLSNSAKAIAEAASHEAGHNLNLKHDGRIMPSEEYYKGGGRSPGWAPIMGNSYASILTQFSRGDYASASNSENDFTLIQDQGVARYGDADNNSFEQASMIDLDSSGYGSLVDSIAINSYDGLEAPDFDYFKFISPVNGIVDLKVNNALIYADPLDTAMFKASDLPAGFGNLHLDAQIYGNSGEVLADWNNNNALDVSQLSYSGLVSGETYLIRIQANSNLPDQTYGESSWGSVGSYVLRLQTTSFPTIAIEAIDADASETAVGVAADPAVFRLTRSGNTDKALSVTVA